VDLDTGGDEGSSMKALYGATGRVTAILTAQAAQAAQAAQQCGEPAPVLPAEAP
jgi:hypothetical protein